jgi:hypothetical protein
MKKRSDMKKQIMMAVLAALFAGVGANAFATACVANGTFTNPPGTFSNNTCTGTNQLVNTCGDATPIGNAKEFIYQVTLGPVNSAAFTVVSPGAAGAATGFNPYVAFMSGAPCNSLDTCSTNNAENAGNATTSVTVGPSANAPAGVYFLVITDPAAAANCGPFNVTLAGQLPVTLQKFSVE